MHQYLVTFLPLGPEGRTTERIITAASWSPDEEWIDFRDQDGAVTHRVAHGCVLSVEVLPETATGAQIAAEALAQMPGEPYPLDEPLPAWEHDLLAEQAATLVHSRTCDQLTDCGKSTATASIGGPVTCPGCIAARGKVSPDAARRAMGLPEHETGAGQKIGTFYVDVVPRLDPARLECAVDAVAQAEADALYVKHEIVTAAEIRRLRYGLDAEAYGAHPVPFQLFQRKPRTGDRVHYVSDDGACLPAQVFDIGTAEIRDVRDPAGYRQYREALSLTVTTPAGERPLGRVLHEPGTYSGGERTGVFALGEVLPPPPLITCSDMTYPPGTWHWPA